MDELEFLRLIRQGFVLSQGFKRGLGRENFRPGNEERIEFARDSIKPDMTRRSRIEIWDKA